MNQHTDPGPADVLFFESHPVQYKAPVYQALQKILPDRFEVIYATDVSVRTGNIDQGFGTEVVWDIPLLTGYRNRVLNNERGTPITTPGSLTGRGIFSILMNERPKAIVLTHFRYRFDQAAYLAALLLGIPILIRQETQDEMYPVRRPLAKHLLRKLAYRLLYLPAQHAFAFGVLNFEHLCRHGVACERISYARFSVPDPMEDMPPEKKEVLRTGVRSDLGADLDSIVVAFFGKFISKKNPQLIPQSIALLPQEIRSRVIVLYVGSGELQGALQQQADENLRHFGVPTRFAGFINQSKLPGYYLAADITVLPSSYEETWGLVVNEALNAGCAVAITTAVGCQREFAGLERVRVVPNGSAGELAAAISELARFTRDFDWSREFMHRYSTTAAAQGLAHGLQKLFPRKTNSTGD